MRPATRAGVNIENASHATANLAAHINMANAQQQENMLLTEHFTWPPIVCTSCAPHPTPANLCAVPHRRHY
jgi:hypothetical protein